MIFLKDIPIVSNGIFIYQLENKKDYKEYYQNIEYNKTYENDDLIFVSKNLSVLNKIKDLKTEINSCCNHFIKNILSMSSDFNIFNSCAVGLVLVCGFPLLPVLLPLLFLAQSNACLLCISLCVIGW